MFDHLFLTKLPIKLGRLLARHWLVALCVAGVAGVLWVGAPAWAAPVARPLNQTVPRPTPTSEGEPVATATPNPDDDDDGGDPGDGSGTEESSDAGSGSEPSADDPNIDFGPGTGAGGPGGGAAAPLTAQANVNGLNVREGPGTNFNVVGTLPTGTQVTVLSRNEDGTWWFICCVPNTETTGWVSAQLLTPGFDGAQAATLLPLFGTEPEVAPEVAATPEPATQALPQGEQPLAADFKIDPFFVWQGITTTLTITLSNPNTVDAVGVLLSDELPETLLLIDAAADAGGTVETVTTAGGRSLLLFRWETIPADSAVSVTIVAQIDPTLPDGAVIDNLVAMRARNVAYSTDAVTIGMPPVIPPSFQ